MTHAPDTDASGFFDACRWKQRPLVVVAPRPDVQLVHKQRAALQGLRHELTSRDMVWIEVLGKDVTIDFEARPGMTADGIRRRFNATGDDGVVLLVGKDGGVKLRRAAAISADELFGTIDAMPMRRSEVHDRP